MNDVMPVVASGFDTKVVLEQKIEYLEMKAQEVASDGNSGAIRYRQMELLLNEIDRLRADLLQIELSDMYQEINANAEFIEQNETSSSGNVE